MTALDILGGIEVHCLEARADLFERSHFDNDLLHEEGIPSW